MNELHSKFIKWLGPKGIKFFQDLLDEHGTLMVCLSEGDIPHPVHFREGMQVRNWMRDQDEFKNNLDCHWLDDHWEMFVKTALERYNEKSKEGMAR